MAKEMVVAVEGGEEWVVPSGWSCMVGRDDSCEVQLPVGDVGIARYAAEVTFSDDNVEVDNVSDSRSFHWDGETLGRSECLTPGETGTTYRLTERLSLDFRGTRRRYIVRCSFREALPRSPTIISPKEPGSVDRSRTLAYGPPTVFHPPGGAWVVPTSRKGTPEKLNLRILRWLCEPLRENRANDTATNAEIAKRLARPGGKPLATRTVESRVYQMLRHADESLGWSIRDGSGYRDRRLFALEAVKGDFVDWTLE